MFASTEAGKSNPVTAIIFTGHGGLCIIILLYLIHDNSVTDVPLIKHRVQNPRRVTNTKLITSTHAQMCSHIVHLLVGVSIASMELATKILCA